MQKKVLWIFGVVAWIALIVAGDFCNVSELVQEYDLLTIGAFLVTELLVWLGLGFFVFTEGDEALTEKVARGLLWLGLISLGAVGGFLGMALGPSPRIFLPVPLIGVTAYLAVGFVLVILLMKVDYSTFWGVWAAAAAIMVVTLVGSEAIFEGLAFNPPSAWAVIGPFILGVFIASMVPSIRHWLSMRRIPAYTSSISS